MQKKQKIPENPKIQENLFISFFFLFVFLFLFFFLPFNIGDLKESYLKFEKKRMKMIINRSLSPKNP